MEADHRLNQFPYHFSNVAYVGPYPANTQAPIIPHHQLMAVVPEFSMSI
jgi:hypothetical protein